MIHKERPRCLSCNKDLQWDKNDDFTDLASRFYNEDNQDIICFECKPSLDNRWYPIKPTKSWIIVFVHRQYRCEQCGTRLFGGSSGGQWTLGNEGDNKTYKTLVYYGLCETSLMTHDIIEEDSKLEPLALELFGL